MAFDSNGSSSINRSLNRSSNELTKSFEKLSSGKRINRASDDAAGLAIAEALKADAVVLKQSNRNISDADSAIQIADSALQQVGDISIRLSELATQAANGTLSDEQRSSLNNEFQQLTQEVQRIGATTEFNGKSLLNGEDISVQAGTDASANSQITAGGTDISSLVASLASQSIGTLESARSAIQQVESFSASVASSRGDLGASSARLEVAGRKNEEQRVNSLAAESRIRDADVAEETANLVSSRIRQQTSVALSAQNNLNANQVLNLLK